MRILLISLYARPDIGPDPPLIDGWARYWITRGCHVTVLSSFPHYKQTSLPKQYRGRLFEREHVCSGYTIIRTWVYVPGKEMLWRRVLNYFSFLATGTLAGLRIGPQDIILVYSPPPTNGMIAFLLSRLRRIPYVYMVQDVYPDVLVKLGVIRNRYLVQLMESVEKFYYNASAAVTVISDAFRRNLLHKGVPEHKVRVIPNSTDTEFITPRSHDTLYRKENGWDDKFVVMYAGNVGLSQGIDTLLDVAEALRDSPHIQIVIISDGELFKRLAKEAKQRGLPNIAFRRFEPHSRLPEVLATADVSLVMLKRGVAADSVPSKTYSIMASERPIIAAVDEGSDTWNLVETARAGLCVPPEDTLALSEAIKRLANRPEEAVEYGQNARKYVVKHFSPSSIGEQYLRLFREIIGAQRQSP